MLKDFITIFYEPLAKVYKAANIADCVSDLQIFLNDLIKTVEQAEEGSSLYLFLPLFPFFHSTYAPSLPSPSANLIDPQKTVQTFVDLVGRHEARFYHFVHSVHSKGEGLFDNLMSWISLFLNFVRSGLPSPVSLEFVLPHAGEERRKVMKEVDGLVDYHRRVKKAHFERMRRRLERKKGGGTGRGDERDRDAAFVETVLGNLKMGDVLGDVADVAAEDSEEDDEEEDGGSEEGSEDEEEEEGVEVDEKPLPPVPGGLVPIPTKSLKQKKEKKERINKRNGKVVIDQPKLVEIPKLVPLFVELVRSELRAARVEERLNVPRPM